MCCLIWISLIAGRIIFRNPTTTSRPASGGTRGPSKVISVAKGTVDTPQELKAELQALSFPEQVFNEAMRQLGEGGEAMFFLDTIWATAEEAGGFNIGVTGDSEYAGPIHAANEEELAGWLAQFIGEQGAVTRAVVATIINNTAGGQRYETEPTYLWRLNVLRQQRQQRPSQKG
jgi:hypothetical protein